jgi:hypothetical protein
MKFSRQWVVVVMQPKNPKLQGAVMCRLTTFQARWMAGCVWLGASELHFEDGKGAIHEAMYSQMTTGTQSVVCARHFQVLKPMARVWESKMSPLQLTT